jgi:predicted DNA-binding protein (UPF0251 family)
VRRAGSAAGDARWGPAEVTRARQLLDEGEINADDVAGMLKVSRRTLFRELRAAREREALGRTA